MSPVIFLSAKLLIFVTNIGVVRRGDFVNLQEPSGVKKKNKPHKSKNRRQRPTNHYYVGSENNVGAKAAPFLSESLRLSLRLCVFA